jgi:hypothetical protein
VFSPSAIVNAAARDFPDLENLGMSPSVALLSHDSGGAMH